MITVHFGRPCTPAEIDTSQGFAHRVGIDVMPVCDGLVLDGKQIELDATQVTCRACLMFLLPQMLQQMAAVVATLNGLDKLPTKKGKS